MPIYVLRCDACATTRECLVRGPWPAGYAPACPQCGGPRLRVPTAAAVRFAGGGWAADGYATTPAAPEDPA